MSSDGSVELYRKHRPRAFKQVVGQPDAVRMLREFLARDAVPHVLLFVGPSGCGKTTLARILRRKLGCGDCDFHEVNAASARGIDMAREISQRMGLSPLGGKCRVWLIDEAGQLTPQAQKCFLKLLEDTPGHVYFMLATTDPQKLDRTIITRSTEIKVRALSEKELEELILEVEAKEGEEGPKVSDEVVDKIVEIADGSARKALVLLNQVIGLEDEEKQLAALAEADSKRQAIEICRLLLKPNPSWSAMAKLLGEVDDDPEGVRRMMLGYMAKVALSGGKSTGQAIRIMDACRDGFYDSGRAGLVLACWEILYDGD